MLLRIALVASLGLATLAPAAEIVIDYTYAGDFFSSTTADGQAARQTLEAVAGFYSTILEDSLTAIEVPSPIVSATSGTTSTFSWEATFSNPAGPGLETAIAPAIGEDEFLLYVGAQPLAGPTTAQSGFGRHQIIETTVGSGFTTAEFPQLLQIGGMLDDAILHRGQGSNDFAAWGGSVSFDTETNWNFDHTVEPAANENDLFSVALHEFGHALGVGGSDEWKAFVSPSFAMGEDMTFTGPQATEANGGTSPSLNSSGAHFAAGTTSTVYGQTTAQKAALDPFTGPGEREWLTELDAAALRDIGWSVVQSVIPEPATFGMSLLAFATVAGIRRR